MNKSFITINGKQENKINVLDHGLLYGDGIYETIRVFDKRAFMLSEHLDRLFNSAKLTSLTIPYSKVILTDMIISAFSELKLKDAFIRLIITRGEGEQGLIVESKPNVIIIINNREFKPLSKISATIPNIKRVDKNALNPKIKSLNYLNNILAKREALNGGFDEALLLNNDGFLTEATTSNLFIVKNNEILTPSLECGILVGITRKAVLSNFKVSQTNLSKEDLLNADEVFLTGTTNMVTCIEKVNNKGFGNYVFTKKIFDKLIKLTEKGTLLTR